MTATHAIMTNIYQVVTRHEFTMRLSKRAIHAQVTCKGAYQKVIGSGCYSVHYFDYIPRISLSLGVRSCKARQYCSAWSKDARTFIHASHMQFDIRLLVQDLRSHSQEHVFLPSCGTLVSSTNSGQISMASADPKCWTLYSPRHAIISTFGLHVRKSDDFLIENLVLATA